MHQLYKTINELIRYKYQENEYFDTTYDFYVEYLFNQYIKGRNIKQELDEWNECAKAVILGDIYKRKYPFLDFEFGEEFLDSELSRMVLFLYKAEDFKHLKDHIVYCDESMNLRRIKLNEGTRQTLRNKFFVLGGIIAPKNVPLSEFNDLFPKHNGAEFKYKFFSYGKNMPECLSSPRLTKLFDFLLENDIKIHFNAKNYLFYSLTDIIDSLGIQYDSVEDGIYLKSILYHFLMKKYDETIDLLLKYDYPSIPFGSEHSFIKEMISIYEQSLNDNCSKESNLYKSGFSMLRILKHISFETLPLIQDNTPCLLEDSLMMEYIHTGVIFINNGVIFDEEQKIEEELDNIESSYLQTLNCSFANSETTIGLQISDAVVGFISRLIEYICNASKEEIENIVGKICKNKNMIHSITKFWKLYNKADDFYKYSICTKISHFDRKLFDDFFELVLASVPKE